VTRLWVDVEDLFEYAANNPRPSGIQRLAFEIYLALQRRYGPGGQVRFVRHAAAGGSFVTVPFERIETLFTAMIAHRPAPSPAPKAEWLAADSPLQNARRRLTHRLPIRVRQALLEFAIAQLQAFRAFAIFLRETGLAIAAIGRRRPDAPRGEDFAGLVRHGDVLVVLGAPWSHPEYAKLIAKVKREHGMRMALLAYDIIPLQRPEWCDRSLTRIFKSWFDTVLPFCDCVLAISRSTARDLEAYAVAAGLAIPLPVQPIPIGTGFTGADTRGPVRPDLPAPGSYVLFVSTIEARKNHALLFRVWRRLLEEMPAKAVPTLVFAGRAGWLVADLMQQLENTQHLGGKIVHVQDPSDSELVALYRGCLFTVFPSLYEGWGLPVTESLAFGKPCVISNATSLPEAGGTLARTFDPENVAEATRVIRDTIEDRAGLAAWEQRVAREFHPVAWDATVQALVERLGVAQTVPL